MSDSAVDAMPAVVVAGDVCLDVLGVVQPRHGGPNDVAVENWRLAREVRTYYLRGGAFQLAKFVEHAIGKPVAGPAAYRPEALQGKSGKQFITDKDLSRLTRKDLVHSILELMTEKDKSVKDDKGRLRVQATHGFTGPDADAQGLKMTLDSPPASARLVVLDDTGNGFRTRQAEWPKALTGGQAGAPAGPLVIYKLHPPIPGAVGTDKAKPNALWDLVQSRHHDRTIVLIDINDLRALGAMISKRLSWEMTALELLWHLRGDVRLSVLRDCRHLIVRIGSDAAIYYHNRGLDRGCSCWLIYDPGGSEDAFARKYHGQMVGLGSAFTAALCQALLPAADDPTSLDPKCEDKTKRYELPEELRRGITRGLAASRHLLTLGFGEPEHPPQYPGAELFAGLDDIAKEFAAIEIPVFTDPRSADPYGWNILDTLFPSGSRIDDVLLDVVRRKKAAKLKDVPIGVFGKMSTYDRREIEAYNALSNLLRDYFGMPVAKRPLSIAVFGAPGSGKSFGVMQVAEHVKGDAKIQALTFNLSQLQSVEELAAALHLVRDVALRGSIPLVFFDEFDAAFGSNKLGWLKYFLAPMQDGEFSDRGASHPIGKAVFIFAGGTCQRYEDFQPHESDAKDVEDFKEAKGPDFVSRLRGKLDIPRIDLESNQPAAATMLRRAGILRFQLREKFPGLLDANEYLDIDEGIVRAFLTVPKFHHGVRSMEAIIDMSALAGCDSYSPSCLPQPDQLEIHVDKDTFRDLVLRPDPFGPDLDKVAEEIHKDYLAERKKDQSYNPNEPSHKPWKELAEDLRNSNREQARHIPRRLAAMGYFIQKAPPGAPPSILQLDDKLITQMAREEHERWTSEKLRQGWVYGPKRDNQRRIHPCLVPWDDALLGEDQKEKDRRAIAAMPQYVAAAGYEVVRATK